MPIYHLKTPLSAEDVARLRVGDTLYISGVVVAALCTGVGERYPSSLIASLSFGWSKSKACDTRRQERGAVKPIYTVHSFSELPRHRRLWFKTVGKSGLKRLV